MCAAMKSTAETSSGCSIQTCQISPVVTGTLVERFTRWISLDEIGHLLLAAEDGFVADDDAVDVAVALGEIDDRMDFALVAVLIFVDPRTGRDAKSELGRDAGHEFYAAGRGIGANRARERRQHFEIGANLRDPRLAAGVGVRGAFEWCVGNARKLAVEVGGANIFAH